MGTAGKPSLKDIERKRTWSEADAEELFEALPRGRSAYRRGQVLAIRARMIRDRHPQAAAMLLEMLIDQYERDCSFVRNGTYVELANLYENRGNGAAARDLLRRNIEVNSREGRPDPEVLLAYLGLLQRHGDDDDRFVEEAVDEIAPDHRSFGTQHLTYFHLLSGMSYRAHLRGDHDAEWKYLALSQGCFAAKGTFSWSVPEPWRRWYYERTGVGGKHYVRVLAAPAFSLVELKDWAHTRGLWGGPNQSISYERFDEHERLALITEGLCIDLTMPGGDFALASFLSSFRKKNLSGIDVTDAVALVWCHVGDFETAENINLTIEVLDYLIKHPDVALDLR